MIYFASRRVSFFCLAKRKKPKKRLSRCHLFPSVLAPHLGGCGTRAFSTQTVLAAIHLQLKPKVRQRGFEVKTIFTPPPQQATYQVKSTQSKKP
jgi:hypothetical protein